MKYTLDVNITTDSSACFNFINKVDVEKSKLKDTCIGIVSAIIRDIKEKELICIHSENKLIYICEPIIGIEINIIEEPIKEEINLSVSTPEEPSLKITKPIINDTPIEPRVDKPKQSMTITDKPIKINTPQPSNTVDANGKLVLSESTYLAIGNDPDYDISDLLSKI